MIDTNKAMRAFKEKFSKMSYAEREEYLKKMGFSFGDENSEKRKSTTALSIINNCYAITKEKKQYN